MGHKITGVFVNVVLLFFLFLFFLNIRLVFKRCTVPFCFFVVCFVFLFVFPPFCTELSQTNTIMLKTGISSSILLKSNMLFGMGSDMGSLGLLHFCFLCSMGYGSQGLVQISILPPFYFFILKYMTVCFPACMHVNHLWLVLAQARLGLIELGLQRVVSYHVIAGNQLQSSIEQSVLLSAEPSLQPLGIFE